MACVAIDIQLAPTWLQRGFNVASRSIGGNTWKIIESASNPSSPPTPSPLPPLFSPEPTASSSLKSHRCAFRSQLCDRIPLDACHRVFQRRRVFRDCCQANCWQPILPVRGWIFVSASVGNGGPGGLTVTNIAPRVTNVGAGTIDRDFPTNVKLGNGKTVPGVCMYSMSQRG
ncbi:hypothetical protein SLEP1_g12084 [Rubroshorea leprosula]|nr:hypothetical protein SLEP1_g12084 [Rubroshorea leprosula]